MSPRPLLLAAVAIAILCVNIQASAQQLSQDEAFLQCQVLVQQGLDKNYDKIMEKSGLISETQRMLIYVNEEKDKGVPFVLNLFLGFGIGSWVQGHTAGGLIGSVGMGAGLILIYASEGEGAPATVGALMMTGAWVAGLILPWTYGSSYNKKLRTALRVGMMSDLRLYPDMRMRADGSITPGVGMSVSF